MRALVLTLCLLSSSNALALEAPRTQCSQTQAFGLHFGERISERDVRRALRAYPDFSDLLINDGDTTRQLYRVTAIARYERPDQADAMMYLMIATVLDAEQFRAQFADGYVDDETLDNGVIFYSGDFELNQGIALQITQEYSSLLVTCTDLRRRSEAFSAPPH